MNLLAIETATENCSVALVSGSRVRSRQRLVPREHGALLLPWIRELMSEMGLAWDELDALAIGRGPGGFTSLRIGISVAQGIALPNRLPVHAVSSLAALAVAGRPAEFEGPVLACLDARMGEVYAGVFRFPSGELEALGDETVIAPDRLELPGDDGVWGVGSGFAAHRESLVRRLGGQLVGHDAAVWPGARQIAELALTVEARPAEQLQPVYLRDRVARPAQESGSSG